MADAVAVFSPGQRLIATDGTPYAGATVTFYNAGSTDAREVFSDADLTVSLGSVVYTDSAGYPVTAQGGSTKTLVYTDTDAYKITIYDSATAETITHDNVKGAVVSGTEAASDGITQAQADVRYTRNANALSSLAAASIADTDILPLWDTSAAANVGITFANLKTKLTTDFQADGRMFPAGTRMVFQQTTPPTGWTKETGAAYDDATLRFETGTIGTGGSQSFNTTFASRTFTGTVGNDTPSTAKTAAHTHTVSQTISTVNDNKAALGGGSTYSDGTVLTTSSAGSGTAHNHTLTMDAASFAVKYVEACVAQKA